MSPRARQAKGKARLNHYEDLLKEDQAKRIESAEIYHRARAPPRRRRRRSRGLKKGYWRTTC